MDKVGMQKKGYKSSNELNELLTETDWNETTS